MDKTSAKKLAKYVKLSLTAAAIFTCLFIFRVLLTTDITTSLGNLIEAISSIRLVEVLLWGVLSCSLAWYPYAYADWRRSYGHATERRIVNGQERTIHREFVTETYGSARKNIHFLNVLIGITALGAMVVPINY